MELFAGILPVTDGEAYLLCGDGSMDYIPSAASRTNGLCGSAAPGSLWFVTASYDGDVFWRIVLEDGPGDESQWEEVVEGSFEATERPVNLVDLGLTTAHGVPLAPGRYGFWYCGRGLDADRAGAWDRGEQQPDEYELRLWPEAAGRECRVVKTTTRAAAYWHAAASRKH